MNAGHLYQKAAAAGDPRAQYKLGAWYWDEVRAVGFSSSRGSVMEGAPPLPRLLLPSILWQHQIVWTLVAPMSSSLLLP